MSTWALTSSGSLVLSDARRDQNQCSKPHTSAAWVDCCRSHSHVVFVRYACMLCFKWLHYPHAGPESLTGDGNWMTLSKKTRRMWHAAAQPIPFDGIKETTYGSITSLSLSLSLRHDFEILSTSKRQQKYECIFIQTPNVSPEDHRCCFIFTWLKPIFHWHTASQRRCGHWSVCL